MESLLLVDKFIDQVAVIADQRKFVSALVVPEFRLVEDWAREHHIAFACREDLCANEKVQKMLMDRIQILQQHLACLLYTSRQTDEYVVFVAKENNEIMY